MKKNLLIFSFCLMSSFLSFSQEPTLNVLAAKNEYTIDGMMMFNLSSRYRLGTNFIGASLISKDAYNNGTSNLSLFTMYNTGPLLVLGLTWFFASGDATGKWLDYVMAPLIVPFVISLALTNTEHHFVFINPNPGSKNSFSATFFFKTKLDYYDSRYFNWFRYKPGLGFSINKKIEKLQMGISMNFGFEKPFDHVHKRWFKGDIRPFGSIKASIIFND
jgi:hypothetical protein